MASGAPAVADTQVVDADLVTAGNQASVALGVVDAGAVLTPQVTFQLQCAGKNHVDSGQTVTLIFNVADSTIPAGGSMHATAASIGAVPPAWPDDTSGGGSTNCPAPAPTLTGWSTVTLTAPTIPGDYTYIAAYGNPTLTPAGAGDPQAITSTQKAVTITLTVPPAAATDTTAPDVTVTPPAPDGANDWFVSTPVSVAVTATDAAGIAGIDCTPAFTQSSSTSTSMTGTVEVTAQGLTSVSCTATDGAHPGNTSDPVTADVKIDTLAPSVSVVLDRAAAASGWFTSTTGAPTAQFTCSDATSGVASCPADFTFGEGADQSHAGTGYDQADNSAAATVTGVNVDVTAPTLTWEGGPANSGSSYFGFVPPAPTCTASDALSGPAGCAVTGYATSVGRHTMTAKADDVAGNTYSEERSYEVLAWTLNGFFSPVNMNGVFNTVKGGSTVPLKFEVFAGATELTDPAVVDRFSVHGIACPVSGFIADDIELTTTGSTSLRYDTTEGQFIQNWKTPKTPGSCYQVTMTTDDGSTIAAKFMLK